MDELDESMMTTTSTDEMNPVDAAMAASHTHQPELSPTRVARADPDQSASAEKPRKLRKACSTDYESGDDAAMAAADPDILPNIADTAVNEETRELLLHSRTARTRASSLQRLVQDVTEATNPTPLPPGQSVLGTAADALAAAIDARPGAAAVRSSPPREHIRMAPHLQPAAKKSGWKVWEKRGGTSASTSTSASAPPSPQRAEAPGIATANRFDAISEEPRVSREHSRGGSKGGRSWIIVIALLIAMTATATRGTIASHEWHDQPELTPRQVTPFSSQELQGTWAEFERNTRKLSAVTCEGVDVRKMRCPGGLADRFQTSSDGNRAQGGCGLQQQRMLASILKVRTQKSAAEVHRWRSKRRAQTHAHAGECRRYGIARDVARGDGEGAGAGVKLIANRALRHRIDTGDTNHWHTRNILWLKGRLPWHKVMYYA